MNRIDQRTNRALRPVKIEPNVNPYAEGSAMCSFGNTRVLCTASLEKRVPPFLEGSGKGWVTAEYAMLPRATHTRTSRSHHKKGRAREISRLIGRSLRASVDLGRLDGYTANIDCDVMVADGGTRTASISGAYVALALALKSLGLEPDLQLAAISVGKVDGEILVDLCYEEDSKAEVDANLVLAPGGELVEVQATAEQGLYTPEELITMISLGAQAAREIFAAQNAAIKG
ncbi:ribonuclease PH [Dethiosulfatarculus sandiegensis]|uniref:Ribonuclease PH n=1 Tax=Dethiosulfatarculus sandiegensis TaxID=1429043 RepID=A0A0D2JUK6_9BACT|nr:ribonuclease PH [Dethiosulfatarculus sandiegensis]KIX13200.1 ribonuclease PH [Dethiosulfatarculus sandiegensis]